MEEYDIQLVLWSRRDDRSPNCCCRDWAALKSIRAWENQQGRDIDNKIVGAPGDFRAQAEQAFLNIKGALGAAGGGFEHVVKLCHYFIDLQAQFRMMRDIRLKYFDPARMPASTMIQVGALTDEKAIYEVDVVAVLPPA